MNKELEVPVEDRARQLGWVPLEEFKGDAARWIDAEEFVDRGEHVLPILRANNRKLHDDILTLRNQNGTLQNELQTTRKIVQGLEKSFNESLRRQLEEQRTQLKASLREAVEDRDIDRELEVRDQLNELTEAEKSAKNSPSSDTDSQGLSPEFQQWHTQNPWYGVDKKRTKAIMRAAEDLRDEGDTSVGLEFMDKALKRAEPESGQEDNSFTPSADKVSSGSARSGSRIGSKSYASLPAEAKAACDADLESFVGEGKLFKTEKDWRDYYAKTYYGE